MKMKRGLALLMALCMLIGMMPMVGASAEEYPAITLDTEQTVTISEKGETVYFAFTPANTESYTFSSFGESDTYGYIYDSEMNQLAYNDDGENFNFSVTYDLEAGKTYILGARFYSSIETGDFSVMLKANHTSSTDGEMVKEPSCTEQGSMNCVCDVCGETYTQAIPTVPHTWDANNTCTVCQYALPAPLTDTETTVTISEGGEIAFFSYTPAYTHEYEFYAISDSDTYGHVYDMDMNELACDDDSGDETDFLICYTFEAGETYILGAKYLSDGETGTFQVVLKAKHSCSTEGVVTKEPTCTEDGEMICICDVCGDEYTEVIPGGHTWAEDEMVCDRCGVEFHEEGTCGDDVTWVLDETGTLTISGTGEMYDYYFDPSPWSELRPFIKHIVIQNGVTSISGGALFRVYNATDVSIANSVAYIGTEAFYECVSLTSIDLPASVTSIGGYAFGYCSSLSEIIFTGDAPEITYDAFAGVTADAYYPADNATWTSDVMQNYGGTITWVAMSDAFVAEGVCGDNLTWTLDNDGVLTISGEGAMDDFSTGTAPWNDYRDQILSVVVEEGVTSIGTYAFADCENLAEVMLPDGLETIGTYAFAMAGLTEISIPSSVDAIGRHALDCPDMTAIHASYDENGGWYYSIDGILHANGELVRVPMAYPEEDLLLDSHSVTEYALSGCRNITSLTISARASRIRANAFADLSTVTSVRFQGDPFEFDANMFSGMECTVEYPASNTLWTDAVKQQYGGTITWKPYGTDLVAEGICGESLVYGLYGYPQDNATWKLTSDGTLTLSGTGVVTHGGFGGNHPWCEIAVNDATRITRVVVEEGLTRLGALPFVACEYITEVTLPSTLTAFDQGAFCGLPRLKTVDLPEGTTVLSDYMFGGCSSLEELEIPASVTTIMENAMADCTSLNQIRFCGDAPSIHSTAFSKVTATAYYPAGNATWTSDVMQNYGGTITWVAQYEMLDGDGSVVQMGGTPELEVRAAGEISEFEGVTVDGELVDPSNYTVTEGSTIVTFKPEYLKTLEEGDHTIEVYFTGGVAIAEVSVEKPAGILGDLDLNGLVNSDDLTLLARHVGGIELVTGQALLNADVNGDGKVNSDDLTKHARYVGGIITDWDQE